MLKEELFGASLLIGIDVFYSDESNLLISGRF